MGFCLVAWLVEAGVAKKSGSKRGIIITRSLYKPQSSKPWNLTLGDLQPRSHILDRVKWTPTSASKIKPKFFVVDHRDTRSSSSVMGSCKKYRFSPCSQRINIPYSPRVRIWTVLYVPDVTQRLALRPSL